MSKGTNFYWLMCDDWVERERDVKSQTNKYKSIKPQQQLKEEKEEEEEWKKKK